MEKGTIFKVGDRVFDCSYGWGKISKLFHSNYPIYVRFEIGKAVSYTFDGRVEEYGKPTLSFTEYTLEGFSQERPSKFKEGDECVFMYETGYFEQTRYYKGAEDECVNLLTMEEFKEFINQNY